MTITPELQRELKIVSAPLVAFLRKNFDPHTTALVENDFVTLRQDECRVNFPMNIPIEEFADFNTMGL